MTYINNQKSTGLDTLDNTTLDGTDLAIIGDVSDSGRAKGITWTSIKSFLKTYFDTLYGAVTIALYTSVKTYGAIGDGTADDTTAIQNALASGKTIFFPNGTYKYTSTTAIQLVTEDQQLLGESTAAIIKLVPATTMTNGILCQAFDVGIKNLTIDASSNANVVNIVRIIGNGQRGIIDHVIFSGNAGTSGQIAIYSDSTTPATYYYHMNNLVINDCDTGIKLDHNANAQFINEVNIGGTFQVGIYCNSTICMISNVFGQTAGKAVIEFGAGGQGNTTTNIEGESTFPTILLDSGAVFNCIFGIINSGAGADITNNSGGENYIHSTNTKTNFITTNAINSGTDSGSTDDYVVALSGYAITAYTTYLQVTFKANTINTGAATLNVNGLGAKTIVKRLNTTLDNGDIVAGMICLVIYDGTRFVLMNPVVN